MLICPAPRARDSAESFKEGSMRADREESRVTAVPESSAFLPIFRIAEEEPVVPVREI